jgi:hypothetical protein
LSVHVTRAAALLTLAAILGTFAPAFADEANYAKLGRWSVAAVTNGSNLAYCSADIANGKVQLRLTTDGKSWRVGVPYYENKKRVQGYYGFGDAAEVANFTVTGDGWAFLAINGDQLNAFRSNPAFSINLDRGLQTWRLGGAAPAIDKAADCARNGGRAQQASALVQVQAVAGGTAGGLSGASFRPISPTDLSSWTTASGCSFSLTRGKDLLALFDTQDPKKTALFKIDGKLTYVSAGAGGLPSAYWTGSVAGHSVRLIKGKSDPKFKNDGGGGGGDGRMEWSGPSGQGSLPMRWEEGC